MNSLNLALALALAVGSNETATPMAVEVDVGGLAGDRQRTAEWLANALEDDLVARGVEVRDRSEIELIVQLRPGPGPQQDVVIRSELREGEGVLFATEPEICLSCSDEQLFEIVALIVPNVVALLTEPAEPPSMDAQVPALGIPTIDSTGPKPVLLYSGAALILAGSLGLGVGAGLLVVGERVVSDPGAPVRERMNYRPAGVALVSTGAAMAIAGAVILKLAFSRTGRRSPDRVGFAPWAGNEGAGAFVAGRF